MLNKNPTGKKLKLDKWENTIYITLNCVQYDSFTHKSDEIIINYCFQRIF
jgi:hypothetical protein